MTKEQVVVDQSKRHYRLRHNKRADGPAKSLPPIRSLQDLGKLKERLFDGDDGQEPPEGNGRGIRYTGSPESLAQSVRAVGGGDSDLAGSRPYNGATLFEREAEDAAFNRQAPTRDAADVHHGGANDQDVRRKRGRVIRGDHAADRSNLGEPPLSHPHRVYNWLKGIELGTTFDVGEVPLEMELEHVSSGCAHLRHYGVLKVIGKRGHRYVYELVEKLPEDHQWHAFHNIIHPGSSRSGTKKARIDTVDIRVRDRKNGIDYSHTRPMTGRIANHLPEMQPMPDDRIARNFQEQAQAALRGVLDIDYSGLEERVIAHMQEQAAALPQAITGLCKALAGARLDMLKGFTETELLAELARRAKDRRHVQS